MNDRQPDREAIASRHSEPLPTRRKFLSGIAALGTTSAIPGFTLGQSAGAKILAPPALYGTRFALDINYQTINFTGRERIATTINSTIPGPVLHWREGEKVQIAVTNRLAEDTSIHWHGMILPTHMDGVPGLSFAGIKPGETFTYAFDVKQHGTYWYHSHSGFQEQTGHYGAIVIHPRDPEPFPVDRDYVVMLSDWSDRQPEQIYHTLKKQSHYFNVNERTTSDLWRDIRDRGLGQTWRERAMWSRMRMSDRDISDVTGLTYTFLMNGQTPDLGWRALFKPGEKVRLRFINAAAMTFFDVRIPGLKMKVIEADGQPVQPVSVDDFRIGVAETYDVVVEPESDVAYCVFAQAIDRSGYARGTLAPHASMRADVPPMDPKPVLSHMDMGMRGHAGYHAQAGHAKPDGHTVSVARAPDHAHRVAQPHSSSGHGAHLMHSEVVASSGPSAAGKGSAAPVYHKPEEFGPHVDMRADAPEYRLSDPGVGLREHRRLYDRTVLTYADLRHRYGTPDPRDPEREIQLHVTGNMARYMWSFDGVKYTDAAPLELSYGERIRFTLVNDTMMNHPVHLHGMWSDLESGDGDFMPRKHTVVVQPGAKISYLVTADARGRWAYHCHLLYHMLGMFREVRVI